MTYCIKNWAKLQHFKDRTPPWIKLYRDILDDPDWHDLDGDTAKILIGLWLIASEDKNHNGELPCTRKLAFRLRTTEVAIEQALLKLSHWLCRDDDEEISERYRDDAPETETETETERECPEKVPDAVPESKTAFEEFWKAYPRTPNMSKSAALKSWEKQKCGQLPQEQLLQAVAKYKAFLASETKKNGREYPAKHAQGWITERRWEGYWEQPVSQQNNTRHEADWADKIPQWNSFKANLSPTEWAMWFKTSHPNGSIETLVVPSSFAAAKIEEKYGPRLQAHFGEGFNIKVKS